jgi:hypothetical protein
VTQVEEDALRTKQIASKTKIVFILRRFNKLLILPSCHKNLQAASPQGEDDADSKLQTYAAMAIAECALLKHA